MKGGISIFTQVFLAFLLFAIVPVAISSFLVAANYDELVTALSEQLGNHNPAETFSLNRDASILVAMTIVITSIISLFASLLLSRNLTTPIQGLLRAIERVGKGDLDVRVPVRSADELGLLSRGFNRMAKQLGAYQSALAGSKQNLEHRVAERTAELSLAYDELKKTSGKIQETNQLKTEFVANMSHELRTPLSAIIGFTELLGEGIYDDLTPRQAETLGKIQKNARSLLGLINSVLDLSKIEAGKMDVHCETFDLEDLVHVTADNLRPLFDKKGLLLIVRTEGKVAAMTQDMIKVQQILINLLSNALKFTETGNVTVATVEEPERGTIRIEVTDTGIGIPEDKLDMVFEQFLQLDGGTARQYGGTGLGLALVRRLVNLLNGTVVATSRVGEGSRFTVRLPKEYRESAPAEEAQSEDIAKVMIVDDDMQTLALLSENIPPADYRAVRCLGGSEALQKALETRPAVIVLDAVMPGRDGWMVFQDLQNNPMTNGIPVIMMDQSENHLPGNPKINGWLKKPVESRELLDMIRGLVLADREMRPANGGDHVE